jgi:hypothetical protein
MRWIGRHCQERSNINLKASSYGYQNKLIGVCTMQKNTAMIQDILDDCCPNCGKRGKDNKHLNRCPDPGRVKNLSGWSKEPPQVDDNVQPN